MREQINLQIALNPGNKSHMDLLEWLDDQTKNRSAFIRETLLLRMWGMLGGLRGDVATTENKSDLSADSHEIRRLLQV